MIEAYRKLNTPRRINENAEADYTINRAKSHTLAELVGKGFAKYFQFCDHEPSDREYEIGDGLRSRVYFEGYLARFVEPKPAYKGKLKPFYYLLGTGSFYFIVDIVDGEVKYLSLRELVHYLGESKKMPSSARSRLKGVNESVQRDIVIDMPSVVMDRMKRGLESYDGLYRNVYITLMSLKEMGECSKSADAYIDYSGNPDKLVVTGVEDQYYDGVKEYMEDLLASYAKHKVVNTRIR